MKKLIGLLTAILAALGVGYVAHEDDRLPTVLPARAPPQPAAITVQGPSDGLVGRDYFFAIDARGDHGRPQWIISSPPGTPPCDATASDDGLSCRIRCEEPGLYSIVVAIGDLSANAAVETKFFQAIDLDAEIDVAVLEEGQRWLAMMDESEPPPMTLRQVISELPSFLALTDEQRSTAAGQFAQMSLRLEDGLVPSENDPLKLIQGVLGESYRDFFEEVSDVVDELRETGQVTTAPSLAPVCQEIAAALSGAM